MFKKFTNFWSPYVDYLTIRVDGHLSINKDLAWNFDVEKKPYAIFWIDDETKDLAIEFLADQPSFPHKKVIVYAGGAVCLNIKPVLNYFGIGKLKTCYRVPSFQRPDDPNNRMLGVKLADIIDDYSNKQPEENE